MMNDDKMKKAKSKMKKAFGQSVGNAIRKAVQIGATSNSNPYDVVMDDDDKKKKKSKTKQPASVRTRTRERAGGTTQARKNEYKAKLKAKASAKMKPGSSYSSKAN